MAAVATRTPTRRFRRGLTTVVALAVGVTLPLVAVAPAQAAADPRLATRLTSVMSDYRVQRATSGAAVVDARSGELLYGRYAGRAVIPASNTKVMTAVAALHTLGPGYRFHTDVLRRGSVVGGVLQGQLYLKGYGDPTAGQDDYASLARQVRAAGITSVTGRLVADASFFDAQTYNPGWSTSYADSYYAAEISGLTVAPNADYDTGTVWVNYRPGTQGKPARITTTPAAAAAYLRFSNKTTTSARGTSTTFAAHRSYGADTISLTGRVPVGRAVGSALITVHRPELYAAAVFRAELGKVGVRVAGTSVAGTVPATKRVRLARDTSMTLSSLLVPFLKLSNNMHAETLTKTMGTLTGQRGSWSGGLAATRAYLSGLGVPLAGVSLTDGSGLTRRNRLTPLALATTLQKVRSEPWFGAFYAALPVAGDPRRMVGGTMRYRLTGTRAAGNAHAKTGSLTGVTSLSGYVTGADGRLYAYAMISNYTGSSPRPLENSLVVTLAGWRR
ncbi:MAG: D-alanyl-D-alanine carboxypeptidase precursor [Friedmanniella sp.]|nr:D-alanyl-D-alanine carboxypeptidase precursor [Friedmanniella sp.]